MKREDLLARTLVDMADTLVDHFDVLEMLTLVSDRCVEVLGATAAGVMLASPEGSLRMAAASSEELRIVELYAAQSQEGPCIDCHRTGTQVVNVDLTQAQDRWPEFAPRAVEAGFRSVHALPMRLRGQTIGVLNMFHATPGRFDAEDILAAQAFADMATISLLQNRAAREAQIVNEQLNTALNSRIVIEQAKGIIAESSKVDMAEAFQRLRSHARTLHLMLSDVARAVIDGTLPATDLSLPVRTPNQ